MVDLFDESRRRPIPVAIYPCVEKFLGWIFFSVGFGGSRSGYAYLGRAWSRLGFQVVVVEHVGSNAQVLSEIHQPGMRQTQLAQLVGRKAREPQELQDRPLDLIYARTILCPSSHWVGLAGHSFGSYTALATLGLETVIKVDLGSVAQAWQGLILMSPQPPGAVIAETALKGLQLPCLVLTGTKDSGMPAGVTYEQRLLTYEVLPAGAKVLGVLQGVDHMAFAGIGLAVRPVLETVATLTGEFWSALQQNRDYQWPQASAVEVDLRVG